MNDSFDNYKDSHVDDMSADWQDQGIDEAEEYCKEYQARHFHKEQNKELLDLTLPVFDGLLNDLSKWSVYNDDIFYVEIETIKDAFEKIKEKSK